MQLSITPSPYIHHIYTKSVNQYSTDVEVNIIAEISEPPIVYSIANGLDSGNAIAYTKNQMPLKIPDNFFVSGEYVNIWVQIPGIVAETEEDPNYIITIPVVKRPIPIVAPNNGLNYRYDEEDENFILIDTGSSTGGDDDEEEEEEETDEGDE